MRRKILLASFLLVGCGGGGGGGQAANDGDVSLSFSNETGFAPSTISLFFSDRLEGSSQGGDLDIVVENGSRTFEVYLPSGSTTDLEADLNASVVLHDAFGEAQGVAGTVTVSQNDEDGIEVRLDGVVLADGDGDGEATVDGTIAVEDVVARHRPAKALARHTRRR